MSRLSVALILVTTFALGLTSCANTSTSRGLSGITVDVNSENQNSRVSILVIHFTTSDFADSLHVLTERTDRPVSSHYLIPEPLDDSYGEGKIKVHKLVDETSRAWHAGRSRWQDKTALNDQSIGIELVNRAACKKNNMPNLPEDAPSSLCFYPDFSEEQIALLIDLSKGILARHPDIRATSVIGHSDIAPARKVDPGPRFPWQRLYKAGIGAWYENDTVFKYWQKFQIKMPEFIAVQRALKIYGYDIEVTGEYDEQSKHVLRAFQMHFNPMQVSEAADLRTVSILFALIERYHNHQLDQICSLDESQMTNTSGLCPNLSELSE